MQPLKDNTIVESLLIKGCRDQSCFTIIRDQPPPYIIINKAIPFKLSQFFFGLRHNIGHDGIRIQRPIRGNDQGAYLGVGDRFKLVMVYTRDQVELVSKIFNLLQGLGIKDIPLFYL